ncbi:MAG: hypothetical protein QMD46_12115 [Methanomicrobiales archaeon]|nr:hypothetical protein [Methanomicrobiales archaeon]MDI6876905.1 hypothetical protein [Methanomicrobiales archaeon]
MPGILVLLGSETAADLAGGPGAPPIFLTVPIGPPRSRIIGRNREAVLFPNRRFVPGDPGVRRDPGVEAEWSGAIAPEVLVDLLRIADI